MSPSRRTRRPPRPALRRKGVVLLLCLALAAPLAYALARGVASAPRAPRQTDEAAREKRRPFVPGEILVRFRVEPNYVRRKLATPNDPSYATQWALKNTGQPLGVAGADIDAEPAWNTTTGSGETVVSVVDEGVDITHPDLMVKAFVSSAEYRKRFGQQ